MEDKDLVHKALEGDEEAREIIFTAHVDMVHRVCAGFARGDAQTAKDLTHAVFLKVYGGPESFGPPYKLRQWIASIARNAGLDHIKAINAEYDAMNQYNHIPHGRPLTPEEELLGRECGEMVQQTLEMEKNRSTRETVTMFYERGLAVADIARAQQVSASVVTSRLERFRGRLRKNLARLALEDPK